MSLTLKQYISWVESGEINVENVVSKYLDKVENNIWWNLNVFLRAHRDYVKDNLDIIKNSTLKWAPVVFKDNIMTKWYISSCGSKMLENYVSPYSATCFRNMEKNWWLLLWKTNMDEFAMWSSTETSYFGNTLNNWGTNRVPGGSSGWSAVAVAADMCLAALWTDTGWSVRQPAAFCGIVGLKPTYGRVSRYGVQSMASSLDQVWTLTKTVEDAEILLNAIMWFDERDSNSDKRADELIKSNNVDKSSARKINEYKIALPKQVFGEGLNPKIKSRIESVILKLRDMWVQIDEVDLPVLDYGISIYYTLMPAEVSTNLARFDGIRFGLQEHTLDHDNIQEYYKHIRTEWFWEEVKRRIALWTFVLNSANYEWYYLKALQVRQKMKNDMAKIFENYDLILSPTTPDVAWKIGEKIDDPLKMYLEDMYTVPANLAWLPAISVPVGTIEDRGEDMPVGLHLIADSWKEDDLFVVGREVEKLA